MPKDPTQEFGHPDWYPYQLCLHHIHTRYVHLARLVGRRLPANTTLLQHDARNITVPLLPLPHPNFAKRLYASTCKAIPYLPSSPCRTGCRWTANGATPMRRKKRHQCTRQSAPLLALGMHLTLEQLMKAESLNEKIKRTYRTNGTINSILTDNK